MRVRFRPQRSKRGVFIFTPALHLARSGRFHRNRYRIGHRVENRRHRTSALRKKHIVFIIPFFFQSRNIHARPFDKLHSLRGNGLQTEAVFVKYLYLALHLPPLVSDDAAVFGRYRKIGEHGQRFETGDDLQGFGNRKRPSVLTAQHAPLLVIPTDKIITQVVGDAQGAGGKIFVRAAAGHRSPKRMLRLARNQEFHRVENRHKAGIRLSRKTKGGSPSDMHALRGFPMRETVAVEGLRRCGSRFTIEHLAATHTPRIIGLYAEFRFQFGRAHHGSQGFGAFHIVQIGILPAHRIALLVEPTSQFVAFGGIGIDIGVIGILVFARPIEGIHLGGVVGPQPDFISVFLEARHKIAVGSKLQREFRSRFKQRIRFVPPQKDIAVGSVHAYGYPCIGRITPASVQDARFQRLHEQAHRIADGHETRGQHRIVVCRKAFLRIGAAQIAVPVVPTRKFITATRHGLNLHVIHIFHLTLPQTVRRIPHPYIAFRIGLQFHLERKRREPSGQNRIALYLRNMYRFLQNRFSLLGTPAFKPIAGKGLGHNFHRAVPFVNPRAMHLSVKTVGGRKAHPNTGMAENRQHLTGILHPQHIGRSLSERVAVYHPITEFRTGSGKRVQGKHTAIGIESARHIHTAQKRIVGSDLNRVFVGFANRCDNAVVHNPHQQRVGRS